MRGGKPNLDRSIVKVRIKRQKTGMELCHVNYRTYILFSQEKKEDVADAVPTAIQRKSGKVLLGVDQPRLPPNNKYQISKKAG
jgi:hypothetical protein